MFIEGVILAYTIGLLILSIAAAVVLIYNRWVALRNRLQKAFSEIDIQLKRRHDLIGNLTETARGYMGHEREVLQTVTEARSQATAVSTTNSLAPDALRSLGKSETTLTTALGRLLAVAESYPDLKASQNMASLMAELTTTENRIAFARQAYNDAAMFFNTSIQTVPFNLLAGKFGFQSAGYFEMENLADRALPKVFETQS